MGGSFAGPDPILMSHGTRRHQPGLDLALGLPCSLHHQHVLQQHPLFPGLCGTCEYLQSSVRFQFCGQDGSSWVLCFCTSGEGGREGLPGFRKPLFLSLSLSSSARELPNPEKSAFSFILNLPAQLPASLLAHGSTAHTSHHFFLAAGRRDRARWNPRVPSKRSVGRGNIVAQTGALTLWL